MSAMTVSETSESVEYVTKCLVDFCPAVQRLTRVVLADCGNDSASLAGLCVLIVLAVPVSLFLICLFLFQEFESSRCKGICPTALC